MIEIKELRGFMSFVFGKSTRGLSLYPFGIYIKKEYMDNEAIRTEELTHWFQQKEMFAIFFYIWYLTEWLIRIFVNWGNAYRSISFEREAKAHKYEPSYPYTRKSFASFNYLFHE